ncbi:hypothetical protein [Pseudomonas aeruginosa]|uniref:hypothetical protein n=1 Tax=Pseudomonas aeruginosa TaxID=287 RepID=UPI002E2A37A0|nr:hypothetical protein [Pseudomonas aeruginosa]
MTSSQAPAGSGKRRRVLVSRTTPIRLSDFIDHYRQELGCSREEAAFAAADIFRRLEDDQPSLNRQTCWVAEVLDDTAPRETGDLQTAKLTRYFELQALSKNKRESFICANASSGAELLASDAAIYFSSEALTRLIERKGGHPPRFIYREELVKEQDVGAFQPSREHLRTKELLTVKRVTGTLIAMITAAASHEEARRVILNSNLCRKEDENKGPFSCAESLAFIADRLGLSDIPDTDTVAKSLPSKREEDL